MLVPLGCLAVLALLAEGRAIEERANAEREHSIELRAIGAVQDALWVAAGEDAGSHRAPDAGGTRRVWRGVDRAFAALSFDESEERRLAGSALSGWRRAEPFLRRRAGERHDDEDVHMGLDLLASASRTMGSLRSETLEEMRREGAGQVGEQRTFRALLVGLLALGFIASGLLAARLSRAVQRPLGSPRAGAERLGSGDLEHRVAIEGDAEFRQLARSFNAMADELLRGHSELTRRAFYDPLTGLANRALVSDSPPRPCRPRAVVRPGRLPLPRPRRLQGHQ
jgi:HAMP domain-containing protein